MQIHKLFQVKMAAAVDAVAAVQFQEVCQARRVRGHRDKDLAEEKQVQAVNITAAVAAVLHLVALA